MTIKKLINKEVINLLRTNEYWYIEDNTFDYIVYCDEGYDHGKISKTVFNNLLKKNIIKYIGRDERVNSFFYSRGYYKLSKYEQ